MDGTYGNTLPPGSAPMTPTSLGASANTYKTNVNRSKTRKWVEAKVQNYDGDDWGADYDEPEEPPVPPPSARPPATRYASNSTLSQQPQPNEPSTGFLSQRSPSGPVPLHHQTRSDATSGPAFPGGGQRDPGSPWHAGTEHQRPAAGQSPLDQIGLPMLAQVPSSAGPTFNLHTRGSASNQGPQPTANAGPQPSRFPPRKSSMSSQPDAVDYAELTRQPARAFTTPITSSGTDVSPGAVAASAKSPPSQIKPLPFIRPSDIYRRLEGEKEKERLSNESSRPSLDSLGARSGGAAPGSTGAVLDHSTSQEPSESIGEAPERSEDAMAAGVPEHNQTTKSQLAPVAERKSEYGLEGLLDSYGADEGTAEAIAGAAVQSPSQPSHPDQTNQDELRRFSTSPKLPDFTRMSTFGADFFSQSTDASDPSQITETSTSEKEPAPVVAPASAAHGEASPDKSQDKHIKESGEDLAESSKKQPQAGALSTSAAEPTPLADKSHLPGDLPDSDAVTRMTEGNLPPDKLDESPFDRMTAAPLTQEATPLNHSPPESHPVEKQMSADKASSPEEVVEESRPFRPLLPGGWISETVPTPSFDVVTNPSLQPGPSLSAADTDEDKTMPAVQESDKESGITAQHGPTHASTGEVTNGAEDERVRTSESDSITRSEMDAPLPPSEPNSTRLFSGAASSTADEDSTMVGSGDLQDESDEPSTPVTLDLHISRRDVTPTAPLNPRKEPHLAGSSVNTSERPHPLERVSTIDTSMSSPGKESDALREEIIRSLSPSSAIPELPTVHQAESSDTLSVDHSTTKKHAHESTYLGDVYGDYWSSNEEGPDMKSVVPSLPTDVAPAIQPQVVASDVNQNHSREENVKEPTSVTERQAELSPSVRKRFSWEFGEPDPSQSQTAAPESEQFNAGPVSTTPLAANDSQPLTNLDGPRQTLASPTVEISSPSEIGALSIHHQTSQVSAMSQNPEDEAVPGPPSPVSGISEVNATSVPIPENHRLSLAEEKGYGTTTSVPVPPSPPRDQHPALVPPEDLTDNAAGLDASVASTPTQAANILPFRQILETGSQQDRIRLLEETRQQFARMDTGLEEWLSAMRNNHSEYAHTTSSFNTIFRPLTGDFPMSPTGAHEAQQAPQLGAGLGGPPGASGGRLPGNIQMPPNFQGSTSFGHTSNQVGVKSKEFFMLAGKAGKGLLSKGKNKLRNTGDKVFS